MKRSTKRNSYARLERDFAFMTWVRKQPCIVRHAELWIDGLTDHAGLFPITATTLAKWPCYGEVQADHLGDRAMGRKADDSTCGPICRTHHDQRTNGWGLFFGWVRDRKRLFRELAMEIVKRELVR